MMWMELVWAVSWVDVINQRGIKRDTEWIRLSFIIFRRCLLCRLLGVGAGI